ncbi:low temperature requirement protein A [Microbulbifer pacificus]|uniref:low temperature requirement protein A n=1 Tax=Microbulbifer pacificus TaxID=407164 RepID=UPI000CF5114F|nr:low temperature requirement protein A [Microbulbifer pacificus]
MISILSSNLFREKGGGREHKVEFVELFFDLVFVYAITQTAHLLIEHPTFIGTYSFFLMLLSVWWVWVFTSWVTNWLDPQKTSVKLLLFTLMFAGMLMAIAIPHALTDYALLFVATYVFMQLGRTLFMCFVCLKSRPALHSTFVRMAIWFGVSAFIWVVGAVSDPESRLAWWTVAILMEYLSAVTSFYVPFMGRSRSSEWNISGEHMAERCGLLIIIALGESLLVSGNTFAQLHWDVGTFSAFVSAFLATLAMWWIYFNLAAEHASKNVGKSANSGAIGRLVYTYVHFPIIAGIVVFAAADEFFMAHPLGHTPAKVVWATLGGAGLYLLGNILFKWFVFRSHPKSHYVGLLMMFLLIPASLVLPPVGVALSTAMVLVLVAIWETIVVSKGVNRQSAET